MELYLSSIPGVVFDQMYRKPLLLRLMQLIHDEISVVLFVKIMQQSVMLLQAMIADSDVSEGDDSR
jgi:hypothetical protein